MIDHTKLHHPSTCNLQKTMNSLSNYLIVLCLCFHACCSTARPLALSTKDVIMTKHHHTNAVQFANQGKKMRTHQATGAEVLYSWKQPTGEETWKRADRSTLQKSSNVEQNVGSKDKVEDIDVMDYAQPHRKPPIHNWGT